MACVRQGPPFDVARLSKADRGELMRKCKCGNEVANNARACPRCGHRFTSGFVKFLAWFFGITAGIAVIAGSIRESGPSHSVPNPAVTDSKGRPVPPGVTNDAELLIARCGKPSNDNSTATDDPRPPIPSRIIEYKKTRLRFMFIPGGNTHLGDDPPYQWELVGITDERAADPSKARVVMPSEAVRRMPCWSGK
jgi:hypothetical protein